MRIKKKKVRSVLTSSALPGSDFCINPYTGCSFGCSYCYADFIGRFSGHSGEKWGSFVDVKINAPEILKKDLKRLERKKNLYMSSPIVIIGSVTDPYQGVEAKYKITRKCLEVIKKSQLDIYLTILTKGHLIVRDIDIISKIKKATVGMTITSTDDEVGNLLESFAPSSDLRLNALKKLNIAKIKTYVCINPLLPHFVKNGEMIKKLLEEIRKAGTGEVWFEHINLSGNKLNRVKQNLQKNHRDLVKYYEKAKTYEYKRKLSKTILDMLKEFDFKVGMGGIIDHGKKVIYTRMGYDMKGLKKGWRREEV